MFDLSFELVPRSSADLADQISQVRREFPSIQTLNLPDLTRFDLRSWQACAEAKPHLPRAIPHLRACSVDLLDRNTSGRMGLTALKGLLAQHGLDEVIVVQGDDPDEGLADGAATSVQLIAALRESLPDLGIYAALDPYRASPCKERDYAAEKRAAGADGFFTQPFFDLRYQEVWADLLAGERVYWGVSPVLTAGSQRYWERRNRAFLPAHFEPSMSWNRGYAQAVLDWARENEEALYFMPIRADLTEWLGGIV